jgi:hypothetical protein
MVPKGSLPCSQASISWFTSIQFTPYFLHIHFNIVLPSSPTNSLWSLPLTEILYALLISPMGWDSRRHFCWLLLNSYQFCNKRFIFTNKIGKVYFLEYIDIPKVFFMPHHVGHCCTVIQEHCWVTMCQQCPLHHCCTNAIRRNCCSTACSNNGTLFPSVVQQWGPPRRNLTGRHAWTHTMLFTHTIA